MRPTSAPWKEVMRTKLKYNFELMELDDEIVAVPFGDRADEFRAAIRLNKSAADIFNLLKRETTEDAIVTEISSKYEDDDQKQIAEYVHEFLAGLKSEMILE